MTTGPRPTPHPIILHVDANGNPVRLAEASAIYATNVSAVTLIATTVSAINYQGLQVTGGGLPGGTEDGQVQFRTGGGGSFGGEPGLTYNKITNTLAAQNIYVGNVSSIEAASFADVKAVSLSSTTLNSTTLNTNTVNSTDIRAITLSATTVCAVNYDAQFNALSFSNLDNRYLNSSGDSVTGSFVVQALSATTISATNYLNLPSASAIWNASSIQGRSVTSTAPSLGDSLVWLGTAWGPSAVAAGAGGIPADPNLSIQFKNGTFFSGTDNVTYNQSISGIQSVGLSSTNLTSKNISATVVSATTYLNLGEDEPIWNASKIQDFDVLKTSPEEGDILVVNSSINSWVTKSPSEYADYIYPVIQNRIPSAAAVWNASAIQGRAVTSTPPVANNVLIFNGSVWTPSASISLGTITATNLGGTDIVGTRANITNLSSTTVSANNVTVNSISSLNISATSARVVGLSAITISATTYRNLPQTDASSIGGYTINLVTSPTNWDILTYNNNSWESGSTARLFSVSSTNLSSISARITGLSATTISATTWQGLPPTNASAFGGLVSGFVSPTFGDLLIVGFGDNNITNVTPAVAAPGLASVLTNGNEGAIQFKGPAGQFSSAPDLYYSPEYKNFSASNIFIPDGGTINTNFITVRNGANLNGLVKIETVSATAYTLFGRDTSSANTVTPPSNNNQNIVYDSVAQRWKPGYAVYQATGTPAVGLGSNGDIYFQYLP